jgi:hypothetical protein
MFSIVAVLQFQFFAFFSIQKSVLIHIFLPQPKKKNKNRQSLRNNSWSAMKQDKDNP